MDQILTPPPKSEVADPPGSAFGWLRDIEHRVEFALVWIAVKLFRALPMRIGIGFVAAICSMVGPWLRQNRRALENLAIAFPERDAADREAVARAMWANMGRVFAETFYIDRIVADPSRLEIVDEAHWRTRMREGGSAVGMTAHLGNWEIAVWPMTKFGLEPAGVYRPLTNPYLDRLLRQQRTQLYPSGLLGKGAETEAGSGHKTARLLVDHVRQKGTIGFVADHYERRGVVVPFMGHFTRVTPVPAMIARHLGARVWMGRCRRIGTETRFRVDLSEVEVPHTTSRTADNKALTTAMFAIFEAWIREDPEQWMWWNTRWVREADGRREG
jgi:KDO2-lipid IV(A) lauroyltransferase